MPSRAQESPGRAPSRALGLRALLVLLLAAVLAGPAVWLLIGRDAGASAAAPADGDRGTAAAAATTPGEVRDAERAGCRVRALAFGTSDDEATGDAARRELLLGSHPSLPRPGFHAASDPVGSAAVLHALSHRWVVVTYRAGADGTRRARALGRAIGASPVLLVSGGARMPFAVGAVVWGRQLTCEQAGTGFAQARAFAVRHAAAPVAATSG